MNAIRQDEIAHENQLMWMENGCIWYCVVCDNAGIVVIERRPHNGSWVILTSWNPTLSFLDTILFGKKNELNMQLAEIPCIINIRYIIKLI